MITFLTANIVILLLVMLVFGPVIIAIWDTINHMYK